MGYPDTIRVAMALSKVNQAELSRRSGLSLPTLRAILEGKDTRLSSLAKIAKALDVGLADFFKTA